MFVGISWMASPLILHLYNRFIEIVIQIEAQPWRGRQSTITTAATRSHVTITTPFFAPGAWPGRRPLAPGPRSLCSSDEAGNAKQRRGTSPRRGVRHSSTSASAGRLCNSCAVLCGCAAGGGAAFPRRRPGLLGHVDNGVLRRSR
jgi:hypothetical protein